MMETINFNGNYILITIIEVMISIAFQPHVSVAFDVASYSFHMPYCLFQ